MGQRRGRDVDDAARFRHRYTGHKASSYRDQRRLRFVGAKAAMHAAVSTDRVLLLGKPHRHRGQAWNAVAVRARTLRHIDGEQIVAGDLAEFGNVFAGDDAASPRLSAEPGDDFGAARQRAPTKMNERGGALWRDDNFRAFERSLESGLEQP